ncbi:MAG: DUF624 domain-containing protein [Lachnospiraceae bacterium]|nr:DUF624 domain-containing protein [Lachnospiraceae bacterium]
MREMFGSDSRLMKILGKIFDIGYLSLVFIISCIPIITIGAAFTALYYTSVKVIRRERGYVFQEYMRSFKLNFVPATIIWVIQAVLTFIMAYNYYSVVGPEGESVGFLAGAYIVMGLLIYAISCFAYPVLSRFDLKVSKIIRFSFFLAVKYFYFTIPMIVLSLGSIIAIILLAPAVPIVPLLFPTVANYLNSFMIEWVFKKYMPKEEHVTEDGETITNWYNE